MPLKSDEYVVIKLWFDSTIAEAAQVEASVMERWFGCSMKESCGESKKRDPDFVVYFYSFFDRLKTKELIDGDQLVIHNSCRSMISSRDHLCADTLRVLAWQWFNVEEYVHKPLTLLDKLVQLKLTERRDHPETKNFKKEDETPIDEIISTKPYYLSLFIEGVFLCVGLVFLFNLNHLPYQQYLYFCSIAVISVSTVALFLTIVMGLFCRPIIKNRKLMIPPQVKRLLTQQQTIFNHVDRSPIYNISTQNIFYLEEREVARSIALFFYDLSWNTGTYINPDNVCSLVYKTLDFISTTKSKTNNLETYLLNNNVPKKIASYIQIYVNNHDNIRDLKDKDASFYENILKKLKSSDILYIDRIEYIAGLLNENLDDLYEQQSREDYSDLKDPCNNRCFSFL